MKTSRLYLLMLIAMVVSFGLVACGGDDDKSNPNGGSSGGVSVVGVWRLISFNGETDLQYEEKRRYSFNSNNTYLLEDQKGDNVTWRKRNAGTYAVGNDKITLIATGYYSGGDYYPYDSPETDTVDIVSLSQSSLTVRATYYEHGQTYVVTLVFERESYNDNSSSGSANTDSGNSSYGGSGGGGSHYDDYTSDSYNTEPTWVRCSYCNGTGNCKWCGGTGNCKECHGTKKVTCTVCNGLGYKYRVSTGRTTCTICNGLGKKTCTYCNGRGTCAFCSTTGVCQYCRGERGHYEY